MGKQSGNTLLIVLLAIGGFAAIVSAFVWWGANKKPSTQAPAMSGKQIVAEYQARIEQALNSPAAMQFTLERNISQFSCIFSELGNCAGQGALIQLFEAAQLQAASISQIQNGFGLNASGLGCRNFPNIDCPLRIEVKWAPVCAPNNCNAVKSYRLYVNLAFRSAEENLDWQTERLLSPQINLSLRANCMRQGGVYTGTGCLQPGSDFANRSMASELPGPSGVGGAYNAADQIQFRCPDTIMVQGEAFLPDFNSETGRAEVRVEAINNCPATDSFFFQCVAKSSVNGGSDRLPASGDEGQWMQVDAQLAPACDENGQAIDGQPTHMMEAPEDRPRR